MRSVPNLVGVAHFREPRRWRPLSIATSLVLVSIVVASGSGALAQSSETEARALFMRFVAAQNAHDLGEVKSLLWDSPDMLFFSRGIEARGIEAAANRFSEYYEGTWHLEPDLSKFRATELSNDVVQILVPILFTRSLPGDQPQSNTFLISQTFVRTGRGWRIASIMAVANTQLK